MSSQLNDAIPPSDRISDWVSDGIFNHETGELRPGFVVEAGDVVLDVGCGTGFDAQFCAERGAHVIYVDINPDEVEATGRRIANRGARALTPIVSDCNPLPLPDGTATKIVAGEVLEHVDDPGQFLSELVRAGAPGALYMISVPDPMLEELQIGLAAPAHFEKPNHIRIVGRHEFARLVTEAGLVIERRGSYGFYWAIWWLMFWITKVDLFETHPLLDSWEKTWQTLVGIQTSAPLRQTLNTILPKSQYIVARKPSGRRSNASFLREGLRSIRTLLAGAPPPGIGRHVAQALNPAALADPEMPVAAVPVDDRIDPKTVGLHDAVESGWFRFDKGELLDGFPVGVGDIVLDAGCGNGAYSATCVRMGAEVIAVDINPGNLAEATRRVAEVDGGAPFTPLVGDCARLPLADGSITTVIALDLLEFADDPLAVLQELNRVGRPGTRYLLAVSDPLQEEALRQVAPTKLFTKADDGEYFIRGVPRGQLHTIGRDEFERMVTVSGLVVERIHHVGFYWSLWFAFFWLCNVDFDNPRHPLLVQWARTWKTLLDMPDFQKVKQRLDGFMPKRQIIVAWKP